MGRNRVEVWNDIYRVLFPGSPLPLDPYVDNIHSDNIQDLRNFFEREGRRILGYEINMRLFGNSVATPEQQAFVERVLIESIDALLQQLSLRLETRFRRDSSSS